MKIRRHDYNGMNEFETYKNALIERDADTTEINVVDVVREERSNGKWMCIDLMTECKRAKTSARRLFSVLTWEEIHEELNWRLEDVEELIENGCFELYEENEFSFGCEEVDGLWYIHLNVRTAPSEEEVEEAVAEAVAEEVEQTVEKSVWMITFNADETDSITVTYENAETATYTHENVPQNVIDWITDHRMAWVDRGGQESTETDTQSDLERQCKGIRDTLEAVYNGEMVADEDGCVDGVDYGLFEGDSVTMWDFFSHSDGDVFDIEYSVDGDGDYRGVRLMVACGGPNIYINTRRGEVEGYWWTDSASVWLPSEVCESIDDVWLEYYSMMIG